MPKPLRSFRQFACGVGHVINDFSSRYLPSFRLVFLMKVVSMSAANAGWLILYTRFVGAIIFRPILGYLCDRVYIPVLSRKLGKRKSWHLVGSVLTAVSVPLFYTTCLVCRSGSREWQLMVYYCIITTFVMFAICCIEIAHLSLISVVAQDQEEAVKMNTLRMAFMFLTGICSYLVALAILGQDSKSKLTADNSADFTVMTLIYVGIGLVFAVIFQVGTKEPSEQPVDEGKLSTSPVDSRCKSRLPLQSTINSNSGPKDTATDYADGSSPLGVKRNETEASSCSPDHSSDVEKMKSDVVSIHSGCAPPGSEGHKTVRDWFKDPHLYKIAIIYTCAKVLQDFSYNYLPLYLTDTLKFEKEAIAYLPLVVLISSAVSTGITKKLILKFGSKWSLILAALDTIGAATWFYFITESSRKLIYPAAVMLGFGFAAIFVIAFCFATEVIGHNKGTAGFVFSFLGTVASLAGGSLVMVIQHFFPEGSGTSGECDVCSDYVRRVFSFVPASLAAVSLIIVLLFQTSKSTCRQSAARNEIRMEPLKNKTTEASI